MRKGIVCVLAGLCGLALTGCRFSGVSKVKYRQVTGYFVRSEVMAGSMVKKITTLDQFEQYFGSAATMSQLPSAVDFSKDFIVAVILGETNHDIRIHIDELTWDGEALMLYHTVLTGAEQSYTLRPVSILAVDRKYDGALDIRLCPEHGHLPISYRYDTRDRQDHSGYYHGTVPGTVCPGIEVMIMLNRDGTYMKKTTRLGKGFGDVSVSSGMYQWNRSGANVTLMHESSPNIYQVGEGMLTMLDAAGEIMQGNIGDMYILRKQ